MGKIKKICRSVSVFLLFIITILINPLLALERCMTTEDIEREISRISTSNVKEVNETHYTRVMEGIQYISEIIGKEVSSVSSGFSEGGDHGNKIESLLTLLTNCLYDISSAGEVGKILIGQEISTEKYEDLEKKFGRLKFGY